MAWCNQARRHYLHHFDFRQTSNISSTLEGNIIVDHCRRCSNFILNLTPGFNGLGKDNFKNRRETFKFWDLVGLILEVWRYIYMIHDVICRHTAEINEALMHRMKDDAANQHWALASRNSVLAGRMRPDSARE